MIKVKVIADSMNSMGTRLTTLEVELPRIILAELNTHRAFSRNSASSRAIPVSKMIERVKNDPFIPVEFGMNRPGMQAVEPISGTLLSKAEKAWMSSADAAVEFASTLAECEVHKQVVNRLLEPFMWHTVLITATEWENFFEQRISPLAEPHMLLTAEAIQKALGTSAPAFVNYNEWHLPFIQPDEKDILKEEIQRKISVARCARVSYLTHDGVRDISKDLDLYDRLKADKHMSPFEHVAVPERYVEWNANFRYWKQLRKFIEGDEL